MRKWEKMQIRHSGTKEVSKFFLAGFPWNSLSDFHSPLLSQPCHCLMTKATWSIVIVTAKHKIKWATYLVICSKTFFPSNFLLGSATGSTLLICRTWYESRKTVFCFCGRQGNSMTYFTTGKYRHVFVSFCEMFVSFRQVRRWEQSGKNHPLSPFLVL